MYEGIRTPEGRQWACHDFILHDMSVQQKETNAYTYLTWHSLQMVHLHLDLRLRRVSATSSRTMLSVELEESPIEEDQL